MSNTKHFDKEILSAWVDGQASDNAGTEPSLDHGSEAMSVWARYHMIGQVMRDEARHLEMDISSRVSQAISSESKHNINAEEELAQEASNVIPFPSKVWKQAGGFAIAASVALVALFGVTNNQMNASDTSSNTLIQTASTQASPSINAVASNVEREELQTMHDMFLKHEALTRKITGMSSLPTVRVVSNQKVIPVQVPMRAEEQPGGTEKQ